jgi:adenine-specific DNA-methyltransferase
MNLRTSSDAAGAKARSRARSPRGRFTDLDAAKLRGGYYTSPEIARWLCAWAIRTREDRVLEPSCGDGAFLVAAANRYAELGVGAVTVGRNLVGIEVLDTEADIARRKLAQALGTRAAQAVHTADFFSWWQRSVEDGFDAVVGNPPFIRYQTFPEPHRTRAMEIMSKLGLTPNRLTNIWVPFVVAASARLSVGGRLGLVLPAELLQVTYAGQLRSFLTDRFMRIDIVACNELFFEGAEQEVVLLLADGLLKAPSASNACRVTLTAAKRVSEVVEQKPAALLAKAQVKTVQHDQEKWLKYFLSKREIAFMRALRSTQSVTTLATHASVDVGVVTGKNEFFVLSGDQIEQHALDGYTIPLVSRSVHLKGSRIRRGDWKALAGNGERVHLLHLGPLNGSKPPRTLARYIQHGEDESIHRGFKCSIRSPWYVVPSVWVPDGFVFRQIYDFPRVVLNDAHATSTDTIHRLKCRGDARRVIANTYTYMTAASAEIEGRSYGGGVLELEPREAERLLMPAAFGNALPLEESDRLIRDGDLDEVLEANAQTILIDSMGLSRSDCDLLRGIWMKMRNRRLARRRNGGAGLRATAEAQ